MKKNKFIALFDKHLSNRNIRNREVLANNVFTLVNKIEESGALPSWKILNRDYPKLASFIKNNEKSIKSFFSNYFNKEIPYQSKKASVQKRDRGSIVVEKKYYFGKCFVGQTVKEIRINNNMSALLKNELYDNSESEVEFVPKSFLEVLNKLNDLTVYSQNEFIISKENWKIFKKFIYNTHKHKGAYSLYNPLYLRYKKNVFNKLLNEFNITIKEQ